MEKSYRISKNILYNFLGQLILLLFSIITAPFIINTLGSEKYGIFALAITVVGYFSVLDLGLGSSIIKFIADSRAGKDETLLNKVIGTALTVYTVIGFLGAALIILFTQIIVRQALHIPTVLIPLALSVFYMSALGFLVNMILTVFNSIPSGLERMDITNSRNVFFGFLNTLGIIILLILGQDLILIVVWSIVVSAIATISFLKAIFSLMPNSKIWFAFDRTLFLKLIKFGLFKSITNISGQIVFQLDRLLIGIFLPITFVTYYTAPTILVQKVFSVLFNVTNAFFPAVSSSQILEDKQRVENLYLRMTKIIILLIFPLMAILFICAKDILTIWLGIDFALQSTTTLKILSIAYFLAALSAPAVIVSDALSKPQLPAVFSLISAAINLIAAILLIPRLGIEGAAWAMAINFIAQVPLFIMIVNRKVIGISHMTVINYSLSKPLFSGVIAIIISLFVFNLFDNLSIRLITIPALFSLIYLLSNLLIGTFDNQDKLAFAYFTQKIKLFFQR